MFVVFLCSGYRCGVVVVPVAVACVACCLLIGDVVDSCRYV